MPTLASYPSSVTTCPTDTFDWKNSWVGLSLSSDLQPTTDILAEKSARRTPEISALVITSLRPASHLSLSRGPYLKFILAVLGS